MYAPMPRWKNTSNNNSLQRRWNNYWALYDPPPRPPPFNVDRGRGVSKARVCNRTLKIRGAGCEYVLGGTLFSERMFSKITLPCRGLNNSTIYVIPEIFQGTLICVSSHSYAYVCFTGFNFASLCWIKGQVLTASQAYAWHIRTRNHVYPSRLQAGLS